MATHGNIQISGIGGYYRLEAFHDGHLEDMFKDVIQGLEYIFKDYYMGREFNMPRLVRDITEKSKNKKMLLGAFASLNILDSEVQLIISALNWNNPLQYMVMDCKSSVEDFDPKYTGWTIVVTDGSRPIVSFRNLGVEDNCLFEEDPKELHKFLEHTCPKGTYKAVYDSGILQVDIDIHMVFVEWLFKELK